MSRYLSTFPTLKFKQYDTRDNLEALHYGCAICMAPIGRPCRTPSGNPTTTHQERLDKTLTLVYKEDKHPHDPIHEIFVKHQEIWKELAVTNKNNRWERIPNNPITDPDILQELEEAPYTGRYHHNHPHNYELRPLTHREASLLLHGARQLRT